MLRCVVSLAAAVCDCVNGIIGAPCGLRGWKIRSAPFPGQMSYKATKQGSVCLIS